jgi:cell shape-determining protein MreC
VATTSEKRSLQRMKEQLAELTEEKNKREALEKETPRDRKSRETRESQVAAIMDGLEVLGGKVFNDEDILYEGDS